MISKRKNFLIHNGNTIIYAKENSRYYMIIFIFKIS